MGDRLDVDDLGAAVRRAKLLGYYDEHFMEALQAQRLIWQELTSDEQAAVRRALPPIMELWRQLEVTQRIMGPLLWQMVVALYGVRPLPDRVDMSRVSPSDFIEGTF